MNEENKKDYEIAFVLISQEAAKEVVDILSQHQAEVFYQSPLVDLKLAYPIKKHVSAQFGFFQFRAGADVIEKIKNVLALNPNVLRSLIITPPGKLVSNAQPRQERKPAPILSNEALEQTIEEILK